MVFIGPSSTGFRSVDQARLSRERDRSTWAVEQHEYVLWETFGAGSVLTPPILFKKAFEGQPSFYYGVEADPISPLVAGDYPFLSSGVAEWGIVQANDEGRASFHTSATVWITVDSVNNYTLRWTFTFSGTVMRNREYIGGG